MCRLWSLFEALRKLDTPTIEGRHYTWADFEHLFSDALGGAVYNRGKLRWRRAIPRLMCAAQLPKGFPKHEAIGSCRAGFSCVP